MNKPTIMISILLICLTMVIAPPKIDITILPRLEFINNSYCKEALTTFCDKVNPKPLDCYKSAVMNWTSFHFIENFIVDQYYKDMRAHFVLGEDLQSSRKFCWDNARIIKPHVHPFDAISVCESELVEFGNAPDAIESSKMAVSVAVYEINKSTYDNIPYHAAVPYLEHFRENVTLDDDMETIEEYCNRILPNGSTSAAPVYNI